MLKVHRNEEERAEFVEIFKTKRCDVCLHSGIKHVDMESNYEFDEEIKLITCCYPAQSRSFHFTSDTIFNQITLSYIAKCKLSGWYAKY